MIQIPLFQEIQTRVKMKHEQHMYTHHVDEYAKASILYKMNKLDLKRSR